MGVSWNNNILVAFRLANESVEQTLYMVDDAFDFRAHKQTKVDKDLVVA